MTWSSKGKCFDFLSNSLKLFFKELYGDQSGEFVCGLKSGHVADLTCLNIFPV